MTNCDSLREAKRYVLLPFTRNCRHEGQCTVAMKQYDRLMYATSGTAANETRGPGISGHKLKRVPEE